MAEPDPALSCDVSWNAGCSGWEKQRRPWRALAAYILVVGVAWALRQWAPAWAVSGTLLACFLVPQAERALRGLPVLPAARPGSLVRSVAEGLVATGIVLPVFLLVLHGYRGLSMPDFSPADWARRAASVFLAVALPEEYFFRGFLQDALQEAWGSRRLRILGASCGAGLPAAAALFSLAHLVVRGDPWTLLVFFPGLVFGWLYARRRSIGGSVMFHGASNLSLLFCPGLPILGSP